jgi:hypothetical protein
LPSNIKFRFGKKRNKFKIKYKLKNQFYSMAKNVGVVQLQGNLGNLNFTKDGQVRQKPASRTYHGRAYAGKQQRIQHPSQGHFI